MKLKINWRLIRDIYICISLTVIAVLLVYSFFYPRISRAYVIGGNIAVTDGYITVDGSVDVHGSVDVSSVYDVVRVEQW